MSEKVIDKLTSIQKLLSISGAFLVPISGLLNIILIPKSKLKFSKIGYLLSDTSLVFLLISTTALIGSLLLVFLKGKTKKVEVKGFMGSKNEGEKNFNSLKRWWRLELILVPAIILFIVASLRYLEFHSKLKSNLGILGTSIENKQFDKKLRNFLLLEIGENNYVFSDDNDIRSDSEFQKFYSKQNFENGGLIYSGSFTAGKTDAILLNLRWVGSYDTSCLRNDSISSTLLLSEYKIDIDTSVRIVRDFILGYWYLHDCRTKEAAKKRFENILNDSAFIAKIGSLPADNPLKMFIPKIKTLHAYATPILSQGSNPSSGVVPKEMESSTKDSLLGDMNEKTYIQLEDKIFLVPVLYSPPNLAIEKDSYDNYVLIDLFDSKEIPTGDSIKRLGGTLQPTSERAYRETKIPKDGLRMYLNLHFPGRTFYYLTDPKFKQQKYFR